MEVIRGNILNSDCNIICHQVNCQGVMGAGLAKQIRDVYPAAFRKYTDTCKNLGYIERRRLLGECQIVLNPDGKYIANLFGQVRYGRDRKYTEEEYLKVAFEKLKIFGNENGLSIAIPYNIGCGLAGGDWNIIEGIIEEVFKDYKYGVKLYKY